MGNTWVTLKNLQLPNRNKLQRKERGGGEKVQWNEFCLVQIFNFTTGLKIL